MADRTTMKSTSSQSRHFFRPLLPDFLTRFSIPRAFHLKYLRGNVLSSVLLRTNRGGGYRVWRVEVDGDWNFKDGWEEFSKDHGLHVGDFLVFKHQPGSTSFDVLVLDPSACERECYPILGPEVADHAQPRCRGGSETMMKVDEVETGASEKTKASSTSSNPCFRLRVGLSLLKHNMFWLPTGFMTSNALGNCDMILIDQKERHCKAKLKSMHSCGRVSMLEGWRDFQKANDLKKGDVLLFELLDTAKTVVMKCIRIEDVAVDISEREKASLGSSNPCFHLKVGACLLKYKMFWIPASISRSNSLHNCDVILIDQKERHWKARFKQCGYGGRVYLEKHRRDFDKANDLKEGDDILFQLLDVGKTVVMKCVTKEEP